MITQPIKFRIVGPDASPEGKDEVILIEDRWNDWFEWVTQYYLAILLKDGTRIDVGSVKIAREGMSPKDGVTSNFIPKIFHELGDEYFSVGQTENYYETLATLGDDTRIAILSALKDCALSTGRYERYYNEPVMSRSLMRELEPARLLGRLHDLARGSATLTEYKFSYQLPAQDPRLPTPLLSFDVVPASMPPSNVHVLIGRNGVGKTRLFDLLARSFLGLNSKTGGEVGRFENHSLERLMDGDRHGFAGLVTVSFSAFDTNGPLVKKSGAVKFRYSYIGLLRFLTDDEASFFQAQNEILGKPGAEKTLPDFLTKTRSDLAHEFVESVRDCRVGARRNRWANALLTLEADPLFAEANITDIASAADAEWEAKARYIFDHLSSGHSVVLLAISRLVADVEEQSLVLLDEPEAHLHPPLISAFIRALSDLLTNRNGVAIIATHSPVVLQEVPASCVWVVNRSGLSIRADRPEIETFGENVGVLTRQVFNLEVTNSGFHKMVATAVDQQLPYESILKLFNGQLGAEGRTLARALSSIPPALSVD
ncbi:putative EA59 protein [Rhizobium sp. PDO1-076]|uniref:ATP-dependent nuclease n=1 Tax=Rhizobium sp. PDO1-076 TaxID=1125979 RepID=UPI00024E2C71|nr:ATP-binding protein [Rhizobium sp. PDO1-076]EHS54174.1 putative EA59 protein [Rhizobium sp. PDO1-076]